MKTKKLIVNADDFGQSEGINKGIIQAHEEGIVTSASLMVRYTAAEEAADYARRNDRLGVGLHIDLGEWIYHNGNWDALYEVVILDSLKEVEKEVYRQLEIFHRLMGRKPTHLDSHQHIHMRENLRPLFSGIAQKLDITLRRCSHKVNYCGNFYGQLEDGSPWHDAISVAGLKRIISGLNEGITEMACHPGISDDLETMYKHERELEVVTLCDKSIREFIHYGNIELCSFDGIPY